LPIELRGKIVTRALKSAVVPAIRKMRQLAPDSVKSGTRQKWSKKMRDRRASTKQHKRTIGASTVRKYGEVTAVYAGPLHPAGNLINVIGHSHKQVLWGRHTGTIIPPNEYVLTAGQQTAGQQQSAFVAAVAKGVEREAKKR
jgi:hypothetical protein